MNINYFNANYFSGTLFVYYILVEIGYLYLPIKKNLID
jgi:hypothetical protein